MDATYRRRLPRRPPTRSLARPSDRIEALVLTVLMAAGLAMVLFGFWAGQAMAHSLASEGPRLEAGEYEVTAVVTARRWPIVGPGGEGLPATWSTPVTWTTPSGAPEHGSVLLDHPTSVGDATPIVVDPTGHPRSIRALEVAASAAVIVGVAAVLLGWLVLALIWASVESVLAGRRAAAWAREWERVEPSWSGRSR